MCGPAGYTQCYTEEKRKAAGAGHWCHAALELRRTRRGVERIPLRGKSSSGSTSKAAWGRKEKPVALVRSVSGAAG
ncbi:hypothetical protein NDU88_007670 [Pleurodeles waltl]|uniref:Uncharacterized protein n=1 Tax=Pleurodeles waltl TaxID=8319 RepID=A0AAV7NWY8_PLEWA|nr:hypothetical protein NDU88_007670 [Pleurodeles waltl]